MQNNPQTQSALTQAKAIANKAAEAWRRTQLQGTGPIGLDFGYESVNAVQLHRRGSALRVVAAATVAYSKPRDKVLGDPTLLKQMIVQLLKSSDFKGKEVIVSAPLGDPKVLSLSFKSSSPQDVPRQVMELVKERLGGSDRDWLVDYLPVKMNAKNSQDTTVMAAAMPREQSLQFMQHLQDAGLNLLALEIAPQALQRLLTLIEDPKPNSLVINFGQKSSYISHYSHGRLTMDREIPVGHEDFVELIGQSLDLEPPLDSTLFNAIGFGRETEISPLVSATFARLKVQIDRMNQYIQSQLHGDGIDCIYLTGEAVNWSGAQHAFSSVLNYDVKTLNALDIMQRDAGVFVQEKKQVSLSIAAGLAMRWAV